MASLDWSPCPVVESIPDKVSAAGVFKGTRTPVAIVFENLKLGSDAAQEIDQSLSVDRTQALERCGSSCRLTTMRKNCVRDSGGTAIVQKMLAVRYAPEWRRPEFASSRRSLQKSIRQDGTHVVEQEVRVQPYLSPWPGH